MSTVLEFNVLFIRRQPRALFSCRFIKIESDQRNHEGNKLKKTKNLRKKDESAYFYRNIVSPTSTKKSGEILQSKSYECSDELYE